MGALGLEDDKYGRASLSSMLQRRIRDLHHDADLTSQQKECETIRRGWVYGSDDYREEMLSKMAQSTTRYRRPSFSGEAIASHDVHAAEQLLQFGLNALNLQRKDLPALKKGDPRKKVIAWHIRTNTSVRNEWISQQLFMGSPSNLSRYFREVSSATTGQLYDLKAGITK